MGPVLQRHGLGAMMNHYFRPGREDFQQAILRAMPRMLGEDAPDSTAERM
jgi:hypothetical protein